jgi:hypothetical protein
VNDDPCQIKMKLLVNELTDDHAFEISVWRCHDTYKCTHCGEMFETFSHWKTHININVEYKHFMIAYVDDDNKPRLRIAEPNKRSRKQHRTGPFPQHAYILPKSYLFDTLHSHFNKQPELLKEQIKYVCRAVSSIKKTGIDMVALAKELLSEDLTVLCGVNTNTRKMIFTSYKDDHRNIPFKQSTYTVLSFLNVLDVLNVFGDVLLIQLLKKCITTDCRSLEDTRR